MLSSFHLCAHLNALLLMASIIYRPPSGVFDRVLQKPQQGLPKVFLALAGVWP